MSTVETTLTEFFQRTTIPGLNTLGFSSNFWYKSAWVILFLVCLTMSIYQSSSLIVSYQKYPIIEITAKEVRSKIQFPAVSICLNSPVRWGNYSTEPGQSIVNKTLEEFLTKDHPIYRSSSDEYDHREMRLLEEMSKASQSERVELGYPIGMFVIKCYWEGKDCVPDLYLFNNLHFGTCFTFNPGFNEDQILYAGKSQSLMMLVRSDFPDKFPFIRRDDVIYMSLHAPGEAPILDRRRMYSLFPGRWFKLGITDTVETIRLPSPYPSKCVDQKDPNIQKKSFYYETQHPYVYSTEACAETCLQNATINSCDCIVPIYPLPPGHPNKICLKSECSASSDENKCDCPRPCRRVQHNYQVSIDDRWLTQQIWIDWVESLLSSENNMSLNVSRVSGFEIYVSSTVHTLVEEEQKILWADFLGSIGGNISLWIGISIISVAEVVDISFKLIAISIKSVMHRLATHVYHKTLKFHH